MAGKLTVFGAQAMLTSFFSRVAEPVPTFYLALIKNVAPTAYLSGSEIDEPVGLGYQRVALPNTADAWDNSSQPNIVFNDDDLTFIEATSDWGMIRYWALCNAQYDGYLYLTGEVETPMYVSAGDRVRIPAGSVSVSLGPFFTQGA